MAKTTKKTTASAHDAKKAVVKKTKTTQKKTLKTEKQAKASTKTVKKAVADADAMSNPATVPFSVEKKKEAKVVSIVTGQTDNTKTGPTRYRKKVSEMFFQNVISGARAIILKKNYPIRQGDVLRLSEETFEGRLTGREFEVIVMSVKPCCTDYNKDYNEITFAHVRNPNMMKGNQLSLSRLIMENRKKA